MSRCFLFLMLAWPAICGVTAIRVEERSDVLDGAPMGDAGPYERIIAKAHFAVDPKLPANRIICDIGLAPRNPEGLVEFSADLYVLKPRDPARGNGTVLFEVSNRGGKGMLGMFQGASASADPRTPQQFGDNFLLRQGFTLVWLGWQFDVPREPARLRLYAPAATGVTGWVRSNIILDKPEPTAPLADRNHIPYAVVDEAAATLTVRERVDEKPQPVPRHRWRFVEGGRVALDGGFQPGKIYDVVYRSTDPTLVGLGPAAVRDLISFLKYGGVETLLADQRRHIKQALGFGVSQSGRFLRAFLYYGFNADEKGRKVFDGVWAHVAGAGRGSFNHRFAQPSRDGHPFFNVLYPTDIFPFTDLDQTDPETGLRGGILNAATKAGVVPKLFYTNSSYEYWGRAAALTHVACDGAADAPLPPTTRIYFFAGSQHGPGSFPPRRGAARHLPNPNNYRFLMRALLVAMQAWLKENKEPPSSRYPLLARGELTPLSSLRFPKLNGVSVPARPQRAWRADYGPDFYTKGVVAFEPPKLGKPFPIFVPQVDADGNELGGIRLPEVAVPLATYTGWNLRTPALGAPDEIYSMVGSWFPFAATQAERMRAADPRPSVMERYPSREAYLQKIKDAAAALARDGFLLETDIPAVTKHAATVWDYLQSAR
jgi:hypothetical protein